MVGRKRRGIVASLVVLGWAGLAEAAELRVPEDHATVGAAVAAAQAGDVVLVGPGTITGSVAATKSGITLMGAGTTWDGGVDASAQVCLQLTGDNNTVTGFSFVNGTDQVVLVGANSRVLDCTSTDAGGAFCVLRGRGSKVVGCHVLAPLN